MSLVSMYMASARNRKGEVNNAPSMTEDAHILSIERLFKDYTKGIVHNECYRQAFYDDGNDVVETDLPYADMTDVPTNYTDMIEDSSLSVNTEMEGAQDSAGGATSEVTE